MFKNPIKKYASGGQVSQEQQEMLAAFVTWLSKRVKAFQGMQPEQIVEALNGMGQTPEGLKQVEELKKQFEAESQESQTGVFKVGGKLHDFICKHAKGGHLADCGCNKVEKAQGGTSGIPINNASALENYFNSNISMPNSNELFTGQQVAALINGMHYNQPLVQAQEDGGKVEMDRGGKRLIDGNYEVIVNAPGDTTRTFYNKYNREVMQTYPDGSVRYTTMSNNGNDDYQVNRWVGKPSLLRRIMFGNKQASPEKVNAWNEEIANQPIDPRNQKQISEVPSSGVLKPGLISGLFKGTQRNTAEEMIAMQDGGIVSPIDRMNDKINSMPNINRRIVITENEPVLQGGRQAANEAFINSLRDSSKWVPLDFSKMKMFHNEYPTDHSPYYFHEPKGNELDNRPNYLNQNKNVESLQLLKNENGGVVKAQGGVAGFLQNLGDKLKNKSRARLYDHDLNKDVVVDLPEDLVSTAYGWPGHDAVYNKNGQIITAGTLSDLLGRKGSDYTRTDYYDPSLDSLNPYLYKREIRTLGNASDGNLYYGDPIVRDTTITKSLLGVGPNRPVEHDSDEYKSVNTKLDDKDSSKVYRRKLGKSYKKNN